MNEPITRSLHWEDRGHEYEVSVTFAWTTYGTTSDGKEWARYEPVGLRIDAIGDDPLFDSQTTRRLRWGHITTALWPSSDANAAEMELRNA